MIAKKARARTAALEQAAKIAETFYMNHPEGHEAWGWCREIAAAIRALADEGCCE